jgi:hypothetical protein
MRVAPPVQALSCGAGPWRSIPQGLYALGVAVASYWAGMQLWGEGALVALGAFGLGMAAAAVAGRALAAPSIRIAWDGGSWQLRSARGEPACGRVTLMLDLGAWMLVRFTPDAAAWRGARWLPLARRDCGGAWHALRVALHAPQPARPAA